MLLSWLERVVPEPGHEHDDYSGWLVMTNPVAFESHPGVIWLDGQLMPWREARVHVLTHALHYASSVFEGIRAYDGRMFRLTAHSERLVASARRIGLEIPWSVAELDAACAEVVRANGLRDAYVRPVAWRGPGMSLEGAEAGTHVAIAAWAWPSYFPEEANANGLRLARAAWARPAPHTAPTDAKCAALYAIGSLAKQAALRDGFHDALMLDAEGRIAEATAANVFFVMDGVIHTPTPYGFLSGITRHTVMQLATELGYRVVERAIWPYEMVQAQECFLTGTAVEVVPVGSIGASRFTIGPVAQRLRAAYADLVRA